jgi:hypothetical protein
MLRPGRPPVPHYEENTQWIVYVEFNFVTVRIQIFWEIVGMERGPLSLVSTTEELFEKKKN